MKVILRIWHLEMHDKQLIFWLYFYALLSEQLNITDSFFASKSKMGKNMHD